MTGRTDQTEERRSRIARSHAREKRAGRPAPSAKPSHDEVRAPLDLDRVIHERLRLGIISALAVHESLTFGDLKHLLDMTDGNLSVHARRLESAGYVACSKSFDGRTPRTEYRITEVGRAALDEYIGHMEALIRVVRDA